MKPTRKCSIDGCGRDIGRHGARGWCNKHYQRWQAHGDPKGGRRKYLDPEKAFKARTVRVGECLVWEGSSSLGYGYITVRGKGLRAHRYAWEREHGPIPEGMQVDHICHNTLCVNVEHLRLATPPQNARHRSGSNETNSSSGVRNVYPNANGWMVRITKNGVKHYFGTHADIRLAERIANQKRKELFGEFAGKG